MEAINWRAGRLGEIDIVAFHPQERLLVFVEVKTRRGTRHGTPVEAVTPRKQAQLVALTETYLSLRPENLTAPETIRFDVISVSFPGGNRPAEIDHLENAFTT